MNARQILIVEDEVLIADMIERYRVQWGYRIVDVANSYEEAVQIYVREDPDLVLLAMRLEGWIP